MLEVTGLHRSYERGAQAAEVLSNLELRVKSCELTVISGRSGSGKTTLLHCLAGLDLPDRGTLQLPGLQLDTHSKEKALLKWRRTISFLHQTPVLIPTLNAWENALLPFRYNHQKPDIAWVHELFAQLGLTGLERRRPKQLSGGQAMRVALARALARRSNLVLADEPTGRLDAETALDVWQLLRKLCQEQGMAMVVVTHDPIILDQSPGALRLEQGRLVNALAATTLSASLPDGEVRNANLLS
jgi:putative ABC transport system ATP-binding protein